MQFKDIIIALLVILLWSVNLIIQKIFSKQIPLEFFNLLRFLACVPLLFFFRKPSIGAIKLVKVSFFYNALTFFLVGSSLQYGVDIGTVSFIYQTCSFFGVFFCYLLLQETPKTHQILGMIFSFCGVALLFSNTLFFINDKLNQLLAMSLVLFAAASWGIGISLIKKYKLVGDLSTNIWITSVAALPMLGMIYLHGGNSIFEDSIRIISFEILIGALYAAIIANLLGNCLWFWLLKKYQSSLITPFMLLLPPFSCVISYFLLDERFTALQIIGFIVIVGGMVINQNLLKNVKLFSTFSTMSYSALWKK